MFRIRLAADIRDDRREPAIKDKLLKGSSDGRTYRNYIDGFDMLDYITGKTTESPRKAFIYVTDGGEIAAVRVEDWKRWFWRIVGLPSSLAEPVAKLRVPLLFNLRRDPYERANTTPTLTTTGS